MSEYGNWLGILKWSLAQSDGTRPSEFKPMSDDDSKWLAEVMESITLNEPKRMKEIGEMLSKLEQLDSFDGGREAEEDLRLALLDELLDLVSGIDNAKNLFVVNSYTPLLNLIQKSHYPSVKAAAGTVVSAVLQNNPKAQEWGLQAGTMQVLTGVLLQILEATRAPAIPSSDSGDLAGVAASCISAVSSLTRDCRPAQAQLLLEAEGGGSALRVCLEVLSDAAGHTSESGGHARKWKRLLRKILFFLRHIVCGPMAEEALSALASAQLGEKTFLRLIVSLLGGIMSPATAPDDADAADVRESALIVLLAFTMPVERTSDGVVDDTNDNRKPMTSFVPDAASSAAAEPLLALGDLPTGSADPNADATVQYAPMAPLLHVPASSVASLSAAVHPHYPPTGPAPSAAASGAEHSQRQRVQMVREIQRDLGEHYQAVQSRISSLEGMPPDDEISAAEVESLTVEKAHLDDILQVIAL